jgi:hypothetical protein
VSSQLAATPNSLSLSLYGGLVLQQAAVAWASFLLVGVLSLAMVRRRAWRLFHGAHHLSLALFVATLWHARGAWQYVGGGLCLWLADRVLRVGGNARVVVVHRFAAVPTDDSPPDSDGDGFGDDGDSGGVAVLAYTVVGGGAWRGSRLAGAGCAGGLVRRCFGGGDSGGGGGHWPPSEATGECVGAGGSQLHGLKTVPFCRLKKKKGHSKKCRSVFIGFLTWDREGQP